MTTAETLAAHDRAEDVGTAASTCPDARSHWHAERPDDDQPTAAELDDPNPLPGLRWCTSCRCSHGGNDPWCVTTERERWRSWTDEH